MPIALASGAMIEAIVTLAAAALMTAACYATIEPAQAADRRCTTAPAGPAAPRRAIRGWIVAMPHVDPQA